jgi:large subunit ribosomal protein L10
MSRTNPESVAQGFCLRRAVPTDKKINEVELLKGIFETSKALVSVDFSGLSVVDMTELRRALRDQGVGLRVVKNSLTYLAADEAGKPAIRDVVQGPTAIAFAETDPVVAAKALKSFIDTNRSQLKIMGGMLDDRSLSSDEVNELAYLPGMEELIARLMRQMQAPVASLAIVLNGPVAALARVLSRRMETMDAEGDPEAPAEEALPEKEAPK